MASAQVQATLLSLLKTFAIPIGLWTVRNGLAYYRDIKASYNRQKPAVRPLPIEVSRALNILFAFAVFAFTKTLPFGAPTNIFSLTNARIQTSTDVIFNRLAAVRPLTVVDEALRTKLTSRDGRLLYFKYGPHVLADCTFCISDEPSSYLIYALPLLLAPHLLHLLCLGLATAQQLAGPSCARWRRPAITLGLAMLAIDVALVAFYDPATNTRALQTKDIDFFFWRMRTLRGIAFVFADAGLAAVMWLAGTNRLFVKPFTLAERVELIGRVLDKSNFRLWAAGHIRNAVVRDPSLRGRSARYWADESQIYEEREVVDGMKGALSRIDVPRLREDAAQKADEIVKAG